MLGNMYTIDDIKSMSGTDNKTLNEALLNGLGTVTTGNTLEEGVLGKIMTIGSLVAGTIFTGCAGHAPKPDMPGHTLSVPETAKVSADSVNQLAMDIANGIVDEMADSSSVTSTQSWKAAKDIYGKLVEGNRKDLADMFARTINRENRKLFNTPPCCDDKQYDNNEHEVEQRYNGPVYDEETGMMEYN